MFHQLDFFLFHSKLVFGLRQTCLLTSESGEAQKKNVVQNLHRSARHAWHMNHLTAKGSADFS